MIGGLISDIYYGDILCAGSGGEANSGEDVQKKGKRREARLREEGDESTLAHGLNDYIVSIALVVTVSNLLQYLFYRAGFVSLYWGKPRPPLQMKSDASVEVSPCMAPEKRWNDVWNYDHLMWSTEHDDDRG